VKALPTMDVIGVEYTNGTIVSDNSPILIWYDWVNVSETQIINYAIYTTLNYTYPIPIANILGQHFRMADGTQVFIASALSEMEVYRDLNGDLIPKDGNSSAENEIDYYLYTNMSDSYLISPIQKIMEDLDSHYQWSFTYQNAHGYLQNATSRIGVKASLIFSNITLSYDFSVSGNITTLKTNFDIGKVTSLIVHDSSQFSLEGYSLALLYATSTYTSKPYKTIVDGKDFNSSTAEISTFGAQLAQVEVGGFKAYDFIFGGNYTLKRGVTYEALEANIETYEAKAEATALSSIFPIIRVNPVKGMSFFREHLNLTELFGGSWQDFNLDYESSSLIYRICFPVWDGMQIEHDPIYVGYLFSDIEIPEFPSWAPLLIMLVMIMTVTVVYNLRIQKQARCKE
jgi:hypothetical protein